MEEVSCEENEVDVGIASYLEDLAKGVDRVLTPHWVFFRIADMVVRREQNAKAARHQQGVLTRITRSSTSLVRI